MTALAPRVCHVHCPHWAITAARLRHPELVGVPIVIHGAGGSRRPVSDGAGGSRRPVKDGRVGARDVVHDASEEARALGVTVGIARREAEARCGGAVLLDVDRADEARAFEPVARALESITARLELEEPGRVAFLTRGPSRYFGGDAGLADAVRAAVRGVLGATAPVRVGIADGRFTARLAALDDTVVPPGRAAAFLAPWPVAALDDAALVDLLERLGLTTLGAFGALPEAAVLARFGDDGARRHAWARGLDTSSIVLSDPPPDLTEHIELDPPATRVDSAAFAAKAIADRLVATLVARGLACTRVVVEAETEHGETLTRVWRHEDGFTPASLAERVRWQLDGWLTAAQRVIEVDAGDARAEQDRDALAESGLDSTTGALTQLRLVPDEVVPVPARQLAFFGGDAVAGQRADRALSRVQGLLGFDAVGSLVVQGGRTPAERVRFVPWGEPRSSREHDGRLLTGRELTAWPGAVPPPAPARVFEPAHTAELLDDNGDAVRVSGRGEPSAPPARLRCDVLPGGGGAVAAWAGPWPSDVRWWDPSARRRGARWQLVVRTASGDVACLAVVEAGRAAVEAVYD